MQDHVDLPQPTKAQVIDELEEVLLDEQDHKKTTFRGVELEVSLHDRLVRFLQKK